VVLERALILEHKKEQPCEQELERRKQFLRIRPRLHFLNKHQLYCKLQFVYRLWLPTLTPNLLADCPSQQCPAVMTLSAATKDPPHIKEPPTPPLRRAI